MKQYVRAVQALAIVLLTTLVAFYWPWLTSQKSLYLVDICQHWHPFFEYIGDALRQGRYPMWNPYNLCGASQLAVISPSPYYFVSLLFAWLPFNSALALFLVLNQVVAGVGIFLLVAAADWGVAAALLAGVSFALCSFLFSLETSCALQATAAWFPLCLWSIFRIGQTSQRKQLVMLVVASLLVLFLIAPGVPEVFAPAISLIVAWSVLLWTRSAKNGQCTKTLMLRLTAVGVGILLAMPELVPCVEWIPRSDRAWGLDMNEVLEWSVNWFDLIGVVLPHPLGDQQLIDNQFVGLTADAVNSVARYITSSYLGTVILSLSIVGFSDKTWHSRWWVLSALMLFLVLAMGRNCPVAVYFFSHFHWLRYPIKLMAFVVLAVLLAASRGVVALKRREEAVPNSVINCAVTWGGLLVCALLLQQPDVVGTISQSFTRAIGISPDAVGEVKTAVGAIALDAVPHLLLGLATCGVIILLYRGKVREKIAFTMALVVVGGSYMWQACVLFHHAAPSDFYSTQLLLKPPIERAARQLNQTGGVRVNSLFNQFGPPPSYHYSVDDRTVDAYQFSRQLFCAPTNIDAGFAQPLGVVVGQTAENYRIAGYVHNQYSAGQDDVPLWKYCKLTASDFVVQPELEYRSDGTLIATHRPLSQERFEPIDYNRTLKARTYRVKGVLPRPYFPETLKWGAPHESVVKFVAMSEQTGFDPSHVAILEHNQAGERGRPVAAAAPSSPPAHAEFALDEPEHIRLKVFTPRDNYLILADTFYPGWTASVDSSPTEIFRANAMMRAVFVPAGEHVVEFQYSPDSLKLGIALALVGILIVVGAALTAFQFTPASRTVR